jgi:hypothetical protein
MIKRLILLLLLLSAAFRVGAIDYTDLYYVPGEEGWGANVVQSDSFMFVTFFIYGQDNKPAWYSAQLTRDGTGNYNGKLYATTGTYYPSPWKPADQTTTEAGTASFQPTSAYTAKLIYTVAKPAAQPTVTKLVQRQPLTKITLGGTYVGAQSGAYSGCNSTSSNGSYSDFFNLQVEQTTDNAVTFTLTYQNLTCTLSGTLTQFGQLYTMPTTAYKCTDGLNTNASMSQIKATSLGIEGKFSSPTVGGGCREDATFSAVLR